MKTLKAAVIGLGNIGFQFNLDPKRKETWSHVAAYEKSDKTYLAGAVEIDNERIHVFRKKCKHVPVYKTVDEMMKTINPDIVSVCTPTETHHSILRETQKYPIKAVFCEKPLASSISEAKEIIKIFREKQIILAVNHLRRWDNIYVTVKKMILEGKIGQIRTVHAFYPAQIFNIGTHLFDVIRMLLQKNPEVASGVSPALDKDDPDVSGWIKFRDDIPCTVTSTGKRDDLIFEIDIIGNNGRIRIAENGEKIECFSFCESRRYSGYRELYLTESPSIRKGDRFVDAVNDISTVIKNEKDEVNCTGVDGLYALAMSFAMFESAMKCGQPMKIDVASDSTRSDNYISIPSKEDNVEVSAV